MKVSKRAITLVIALAFASLAFTGCLGSGERKSELIMTKASEMILTEADFPLSWNEDEVTLLGAPTNEHRDYAMRQFNSSVEGSSAQQAVAIEVVTYNSVAEAVGVYQNASSNASGKQQIACGDGGFVVNSADSSQTGKSITFHKANVVVAVDFAYPNSLPISQKFIDSVLLTQEDGLK